MGNIEDWMRFGHKFRMGSANSMSLLVKKYCCMGFVDRKMGVGGCALKQKFNLQGFAWSLA
jgi:hypothetical protein